MSDQNQIELDDQDDDASEGVKSLRAALKQSNAELKALREADQVREVAARTATVTQAFESLHLPVTATSLYPAEAEVSADAVAQWASTHGIVANTGPAREETLIDRYNSLLQNPGTVAGHHDDALDRALRGVKESAPWRRPFRGSEEERQEALRSVEEANAANRAYEREVQLGRAQPVISSAEGFGGRANPPVWANRTLEAVNNL